MKRQTLFSFKQKSQDFIVEEELPFELSGKGDAFFVYFEKRNKNTMDILQFLCKELGLSRKALWVAGLKDKKAMTRQWISLYKTALKRIGGEKVFTKTLAKVARIIKTDRHEHPVGLSTQINNVFHIRLRPTKNLSEKEKKQTKRVLNTLLDEWFANIFGEQRFGINGRNWHQGRDILRGESSITSKKEIVFKLQAYGSKMFNNYLTMRLEKWFSLMDGDIVTYQTVSDGKSFQSFAVYHKETEMVSPFRVEKGKNAFYRYPKKLSKKRIPFNPETMMITGPVIWFNNLSCDPSTEAGKFEQKFLRTHELEEKRLHAMRQHVIFGLRRAIWVLPGRTKLTYQGDDLLLRFSLSSGSYASVLIAMMEDALARISQS